MGSLLACLLTLAPALAQAQAPGALGRDRRVRGPDDATPRTAPPAAIPVNRDPRQRLDAGAVLCRTEAALAQHQAALAARLEGREAPGATGCRVVTTMTPVSVVSRQAGAHTEVRVAGPPEMTGWTDAVIP